MGDSQGLSKSFTAFWIRLVAFPGKWYIKSLISMLVSSPLWDLRSFRNSLTSLTESDWFWIVLCILFNSCSIPCCQLTSRQISKRIRRVLWRSVYIRVSLCTSLIARYRSILSSEKYLTSEKNSVWVILWLLSSLFRAANACLSSFFPHLLCLGTSSLKIALDSSLNLMSSCWDLSDSKDLRTGADFKSKSAEISYLGVFRPRTHALAALISTFCLVVPICEL